MLKIMRRLFLLTIILSGTAVADELVTLDTRPGVKQTFAVFEPVDRHKGVVMLLPGHKGVVTLDKKGSKVEVTRFRGGLTVQDKTREILLNKGYVVVMTTPSSDKKKGMDNVFRASHNHAVDLSHVIGYIKNKFPKDDLFIWAHSRSTISAVNVVAVNRSKGIKGLILSSTWRVAVKDVPIGSIRLPILMVHHVKDTCDGAPYKAVSGIEDNFRLGTATVTRIDVRGGKVKMKGKTAGSCHTNVHGMGKVKKRVARAVVKWMRGKEVPAAIKWRK